ncbi:MAG: energy transducer TonB [Desulfobacteraceae bacterium]|nr:energy transducer TonB [Desulfobacteraceae bacterium]
MQRQTVKKRIFYFFLAILVNGLILMLIIQLSSNKKQKNRSDFYNPVFLADYRSPPQSPPVRQVKKNEPKEKPLEKMPKVSVKQKRVVAKRPVINFKMPEMKTDINPMLETGMAIAPPEPEPEPVVKQQAMKGRMTGAGNATAYEAPAKKEYGIEDVEQKPEILKKVEPRYPDRARRRNIKGNVTVKFLVSAKGHVTKPSIVKASPKGFFEKSVLQAVRRWHFKPGYHKGKPVATWVVLPIRFNLNG